MENYFSPTFVVGNEEFEPSWNSCQIILSASLKDSNKICGKIEIKPARSITLIDHFKLFINNNEKQTFKSSTDFHYSVHGFAVNEQYKIYVVAYPKDHISDANPIQSNTLVRTEAHKDYF
jgi:hypothetical protein